MILGKEALGCGHDDNGAAESLGELDRLLFSSNGAELASNHQHWLALAAQKFGSGRDRSRKRLRVTRLLAEDRARRSRRGAWHRGNIAGDLDVGGFPFPERAADRAVDLVGRIDR